MMGPSWIFLLYFLLLASTIPSGDGQLSDNTPPVMHIDRDWVISATEPVGSVVTRVRASDSEGDALKFGLEPLQLYPLPRGEPVPLPFEINEDTGVVRTNATLKDRAGELMYLYVTVSDGKVTAKNEVLVKITSDAAGGAGAGTAGSSRRPPRPPNFPPLGGPGINRLRPPFLSFPPGYGAVSAAGVPIGNLSPAPPPLPGVLRPVPDPPGTGNRTADTSITNSTENVLGSSTSPAPAEEPIVPVNASTVGTPPGDSNNVTTSVSASAASVPDSLLVTALLSVLCIALVLAGVAVLVRKRFCPKRPHSKEDMQKDSSGLSMQEPMAMQQWRGPRAYSNRYEDWERDGTQPPAGNGENPPSPVKPRDRWEFPRHRLKVFDILGEGCFGQVWRCEAIDIDGKEGSSVVAVKTLKENAGENERSDLLQELAVMKTLEPHPNVVRLLGCCTTSGPLFVIMEFVSRGKLQSYLRSSRAERDYGNLHGPSRTLTSRDLTAFLYQVAKGMEFLSSKGIIHRDLAARNVLVTEDRTCKVADFGFARDLMDNLVYERKSEGRLPIRWMAPESLYDNEFSVKGDVWSYGVLMWEVVTLGSTPYPGLGAAEVMRRVRAGYRMDKPEHCRRELYNIMYYCWDRDPAERPSFTELVHRTEELLLTETDYIELERFPDHPYYNMMPVSASGEKL